jgi:diaminohydroxyphosphoribosylaminopyrimidine deaminase / 5-amino-6-(5-phosphoribosylamino)uracil reductase
MRNDDENLMSEAIALAEQCKPIADRIPKVGVVIAVDGTVIGQGHRGTGKSDDDDHAEKIALKGVVDRKQLPKATVYTTLEPCTPEVRSDPLNCCTELIRQAEVKRVFIGILDPNQGVRGKGLWELQSRGIEVELFPPELAKSIRVLNDKFIKEQQSLGIRITNLTAGQTIRTDDKGGVYELEGTFINPPGDDVFVFTNIGGQWWPQPYSLHVTGDKTWSVKLHFGTYGPKTISIVRANELGVGLIRYYRKIVALNRERADRMKLHFHNIWLEDEEGILKALGGDYPAIEMARLPKGIEVQDQVEFIVEDPRNQSK